MRLKNDFQGKASERIPADWLNTIANFWNDFQVIGGTLTKRSDGRFTTVKFSTAAGGDDLLASFVVTSTAGTVATMQPGKFFLDGAEKTIIGLPGTIACPADRKTWLRHDTPAGTVEWKEGTAYPASTATVIIYPVHAISSDGDAIGTVFHQHPADFHVNWTPGTTGSWQTMGTSAEHADLAGTDTWTAGGTVGLKFTALVDIGYDHTTGTPRVYGVKRQGTWDRFGNLSGMGTETIVEIDVPISHALLGT